MATSSKAPKTVKITTSSDITATIAGAYSNLINHDGELSFILEVADMMSDGRATVRGVQDAIASTVGTAPTIRKSHAQHFPIVAKIAREVKGAELQPIAELLKLAERVTRNHGTNGAEVVEKARDIADLAEKSPTQSKAKGKGAKSSIAVPLTLELAIAASLQGIRQVAGKNLKEATTADLDNLRALLGVLVTIEKNTSAKVKASA